MKAHVLTYAPIDGPIFFAVSIRDTRNITQCIIDCDSHASAAMLAQQINQGGAVALHTEPREIDEIASPIL